MARTLEPNVEAIKHHRAMRNWDQLGLATKAKLSVATIESIEAGSAAFRLAFCTFLGDQMVTSCR
jgi:DNA-binding XRE family transcriptional regulator